MKKITTQQITINAMLAALCAVLGIFEVSIIPNFKITFESFPVLIAALLFGPFDGAVVGGIGTFISQLIRYGLDVTTPLWVLPYIVCGIIVGVLGKTKAVSQKKSKIVPTIFIILLGQLSITIINIGSLFIYSKVIMGFFSIEFALGSIGIKLLICLVKSIASGIIIIPLLSAIKRVIGQPSKNADN